MSVVHMRTRKQAKRKTAQVAILQDQLSPDGFTHRIHEMWRSESNDLIPKSHNKAEHSDYNSGAGTSKEEETSERDSTATTWVDRSNLVIGGSTHPAYRFSG